MVQYKPSPIPLESTITVIVAAKKSEKFIQGDEARKCSLLHTHNQAKMKEEEKDNDVLKGESFLLLTFLSSLFPLHSRSVIIISS